MVGIISLVNFLIWKSYKGLSQKYLFIYIDLMEIIPWDLETDAYKFDEFSVSYFSTSFISVLRTKF